MQLPSSSPHCLKHPMQRYNLAARQGVLLVHTSPSTPADSQDSFSVTKRRAVRWACAIPADSIALHLTLSPHAPSSSPAAMLLPCPSAQPSGQLSCIRMRPLLRSRTRASVRWVRELHAGLQRSRAGQQRGRACAGEGVEVQLAISHSAFPVCRQDGTRAKSVHQLSASAAPPVPSVAPLPASKVRHTRKQASE